MRLHDIAARLSLAGDEIRAAARSLADFEPGARAYGPDGAGRLGELGRALHGDVASALAARGREAAGLGARLGDSAQAVLAVAAAYRDVERSARRRHDAGEG